MLPNLFKGKQFQKSIQDYKHKATFLTHENAKTQVADLIKNLEQEIQNLEQAHRIRTAGQLHPSLFGDKREKIYELRSGIVKILKEHNIIR
tara:strand:- start:844 stop:1116 length:273 start_codon:yes stop_codon:yes gene_type:complete